MRCFVYVLGSHGPGGFKTYVGWTNDLDRRLTAHNAGKGARSTRGRAWILLYAECYGARRDAMSREWHLKRDRALRKELSEAHRLPRLKSNRAAAARRAARGRRRARRT